MPSRPPESALLSRRERQIMDVIYQRGRATAADIHAALPDAPTYTTVRGLLRIMTAKGLVVQGRDGRRYIYEPSTPRSAAGARSIAHVVKTFFAGSPADAVAALLGTQRGRLSKAELARLAALVEQAERDRRSRP